MLCLVLSDDRHKVPQRPRVLFVTFGNNIFTYFWTTIFDTIFHYLPHTYMHIFFASYAPHEHFFVPKMVPFLHGAKYAIILTSLLEIFNFIGSAVVMLGYLVDGILHKNPWNSCDGLGGKDYENRTINCYGIKDFGKKIKNSNNSWSFTEAFHVFLDGEVFSLVQIEYLRTFVLSLNGSFLSLTYFLILMTVTVTCYKTVSMKKFWKMLSVLQWTIIAIELIGLLYILLMDLENIEYEQLEAYTSPALAALDNANLDILGASISAPPVVHVLTARSTQEISPSGDSSAIVISNMLYDGFKAMFLYKLKLYCDHLTASKLRISELNISSWFYYWTLFLSTFFLGNIFTLIVLFFHLMVDMLTIIVTYHCLVEVLIWEWKWLNPYMIMAATITLSVFWITLIDFQEQFLFLMFSKSIVVMMEVFAVCYMYPVGRFMDDITFHSGASPTKLRELGFRILPVIYFIKLYNIISCLMELVGGTEYSGKIELYTFQWAFPFGSYVIGLMFVIYSFVWRERGGWRHMFIPECDWGPEELNARQLRKEYDSRSYIPTSAPRVLSRYMLSKAEAKSFALDLQYDPFRRSTLPTSKFKMNMNDEEEDNYKID